MVPGYNRSDGKGKNKIFELKIRESYDRSQSVGTCPGSGQKGRPVPHRTIKAFLNPSLRALRETDYFFCPDQECPVVYFTADGTQTFTVEDLHEPVYQKKPDDPHVLICYCFRYTVGSFQAATAEQRQAILLDIKQRTRADQCECDLRNPQGACCLGNVVKLIKRLG